MQIRKLFSHMILLMMTMFSLPSAPLPGVPETWLVLGWCSAFNSLFSKIYDIPNWYLWYWWLWLISSGHVFHRLLCFRPARISSLWHTGHNCHHSGAITFCLSSCLFNITYKAFSADTKFKVKRLEDLCSSKASMFFRSVCFQYFTKLFLLIHHSL